MNRRWIPAIVFWALFIASIGLYKRYPWLDTAWYALGMLFLIFVAVYSAAQIFRHRHETSTISYKGIPRWLERFSLDEEDHDERGMRQKGSSK